MIMKIIDCKIKVVVLTLFFSSVVFSQKKGINIVASATPEATKAGSFIFKKGGNAVDVAVAVAFALGVTEPAMSGIGGRNYVTVIYSR